MSGLPLGFEWGAVAAGIKVSGKADLAAAVVAKGGRAAAMFTEPGGCGSGDGGAAASDGDRRPGGCGAGECRQCQLRDWTGRN